MSESFKTVLFWFLICCVAGLVLAVGAGLLFLKDRITALTAGYVLSFLFVSSNFVVINKIKGASNINFYRLFLVTLAIRFILVLVILVAVLKVTKIHQIYFTVSFIISYILHSVIEVISINNILKTG